MLRLHDLSYTYPGTAEKVLECCSFAIYSGQTVVVLGPSGVGKSTLLRLIGRLLHPTAGRIEWSDGEDQTSSFVFQEPYLLGWRSVRDNILLPLQLKGSRGATRQIDEHLARLLAAVGLESSVNQKPYQLSVGMQHRVSLARALIQKPSLLLLDEPFGSLDVKLKFQMYQLLEEVGRGTTTVLVTHDLDEALMLGDEIIVLGNRPGRVIHSQRVEWPRPRTQDIQLTNDFFKSRRELLGILLNH